MKPNFALTLSFDTIGLLHRSPSGWLDMGQVAVADDDLPQALAGLLALAAQHDTAPLRSKLVLPNEQIRYLTLAAPARGTTDLAAFVAAALDGATPYDVQDLSFDWTVVGQDLHIAAVAHETLAEAEEFAATQGFNPVSFVAIPAPGSFPGEPFFGLTKAAATLLDPADRLLRDTHAIRIAGKISAKPPAAKSAAPATPQAQDTSQDTAQEPAPAASPAPPQPQTDPAPAPLGAAPLPAFSSRRAAAAALSPDTGPDTGPAPQPAPATQPPAPASLAPHKAPQPPQGAQKPAASTPPTVTSPSVTPPTVTQPSVKPPATPKPASAKPVAKPASSAQPASPAKPASPAQPASPAKPQAAAAATTATAAALPQPTAFRSAPLPPQSAPPADAGGLAGLVARLKRKPATKPAAPPLPAAMSAAPAATMANMTATAAQTEQQRMTVFGARKPAAELAAQRGKPRFLGLVLTGVLLAVLAGVAAFSAISSDTALRGFFGNGDDDAPQTRIALPAAQVPLVPLDQSRNILSQDLPDSPPAAAVIDLARLDAGDLLTDIPDDDLTLRAPAFDPDRLRDPLMAAPETAPETATQPATQPADAPEPAAPQNPDLSPEAALASYAATGIWLVAPQQPAAVEPMPLDDLYVASIDARLQNFDAVALPPAPDRSADQRLAAQSNPVSAGTVFARDDRGLVIATADGALTPEGVTVFAGRPAVTPAALPARTPDPAPAAAEASPAIAAIRPLLRPDTLAESNERAQLGGLSRVELGQRRPRVRPETLAAVAIALRAADDAEATADVAPAPVDNGTAQAIATSLKPLARPRNLGSTANIDSAARPLAEQNRQQQAAPQAAPEQVAAAATLAPQRNAAPQIPSTASVAQQATMRGAINLRQINLIGVYGQPSNRRALVRLSNGRYQKVQVGDRLDGGQVRAIGENELNYVKGNRSFVLSMPRG